MRLWPARLIGIVLGVGLTWSSWSSCSGALMLAQRDDMPCCHGHMAADIPAPPLPCCSAAQVIAQGTTPTKHSIDAPVRVALASTVFEPSLVSVFAYGTKPANARAPDSVPRPITTLRI